MYNVFLALSIDGIGIDTSSTITDTYKVNLGWRYIVITRGGSTLHMQMLHKMTTMTSGGGGGPMPQNSFRCRSPSPEVYLPSLLARGLLQQE